MARVIADALLTVNVLSINQMNFEMKLLYHLIVIRIIDDKIMEEQ